MKRLLLLPLLASLTASPVAAPAQSRPAAAQRPKPAAGAQGLRARPVEIAVHAPRPKDLPDDLAFYGPEDGRYEIGYLVRGTGFSRIVKDSLRVSSATAGGADVSKDAKGAPSWSLDHFPKVSDDGTAATFTLCVEPGRDRMKAAMPVVHGSIDVERASGKETKTATLSLAPGSSAVLGPVTVRVPETKKKGEPAAFDGDDGGAASDADADGDPSAALAAAISSAAKEGGSAAPGEAEAAQALAAFFGGAFGGGGNGDGIDLRIEGELGALASLVLVADGKELEPGMKMTFDARSATWTFPAAGGSSVKAKAEIWKEVRRETVSF